MKKFSVLVLSLLMALTLMSPAMHTPVYADEEPATEKPRVDATGYEILGSVENVEVQGTDVILTLSDGNRTKLSFLTDNLFRYYVDIEDTEFLKYPKPNSNDHKATILAKEESDFISESGVVITVDEGEVIKISTAKIVVTIEKATSLLTVRRIDGSIVMQEAAPLMYKGNETVQSLVEHDDEYFYGGGTQNGRFSHKGEIVKAVNTNNWVDGGVASPNPFYWTTKGYGIVRNTFKPGEYDFGKTSPGVVSATHNEARYDAYIFVGDNPEALLNAYTDLTGKPAQQPDYAFYLGHLNCYNRDVWKETGSASGKLIDGKYYSERNPSSGEIQPGEVQESLMEKNGNLPFTAQRQIEIHEEKDIPLGSFYPNDGYGCGYGQTDSFDGDIEELKAFTDFANSKGIETGLWTQANLWPRDINNPQKGERDIQREVQDAGVRAIKTDVAWVGAGYSMALNGVMRGYEAITELAGTKAMIVSLDGWAGTQRYAGIWSGDQTGGNWEYIRFHIPTYIGTGLSGMPNVGSDMDGIFGGKNPVIQTRDFQWKAFTPYMLDMDGWGSSQKNPWEFGEDTTSINRAYLKLKAEMMPYVATISAQSAKTGMPMVRAMFLEYPDSYTHSKATQYQYMWGSSFLVAPIYQNTNANAQGDDIRNDIYLPDAEQIWIDYFTGDQYRGGSVLNNFEAPIWKTPVFVKNGAIIPMYAENNNPRAKDANNPKGLDKSERIVEFYPQGETSFDLYEDDGITDGGASTTTRITSVVDGEKATLSIDKTLGSYPGMISQRSTEMIVNVSAAPKGVKGNVGGSDVVFTEATSREDYDKTSGNVYFYDETPVSIISKYASEGSTYDTAPLTTRPKLYIKSADTFDITATNYSVVVDGFKNEQEVSPNELVETLAVPQNLASPEQTPSSITLEWDRVAEAQTYDVEVDGTVFSNILSNDYLSLGLHYDTDYTYRVRTVTSEGHSNWSDALVVRTALDPYRNVPVGMTAEWSGDGSYGGTKPEYVVDGDDATHFHSKDGGDAYTNTFTIDMQKSYELEKLEYMPRPDFGNGTIREFTLDYSLDGQHWKKAVTVGTDVPAWSYKVGDTIKTLNFDTHIKARYIRFSVTNSVGGFFTAHEIRPYAVDASRGQIVGDWNNSGDIDQGDLTFFENYAGLRREDADFGGYVEASDLNFDGVIDGYDIAYVARLMNGGIKAGNKDVQGKMFIVPSKEHAEIGEEVTYTVYGLGMENVYALNLEVPYDIDERDFVSNSSAVLTQFMTSFSKSRTHSDNSRANYLIFTNVGQQPLIDGTGVIGSFKMVQKVSGPTEIGVMKANFVGDNLSVVDALESSVEPPLPSTESKLALSDIKNMTFTNDILTTDDGTNGTKLWQQSNYAEILFDGKMGDLAEFKWKMPDSDIADYVKLPTTMTFELTKDQPVSKVRVHNRAKNANGSVTAMSAKAYHGDTVYDLGVIQDFKAIYEWELPAGVLVDRVEVVALSASGMATGTTSGTVENRMLSLTEIDIITNVGAAVESVAFVELFPETIGLESLKEIKAVVNPSNAINPFYDLVSSDPEIAQITRVTTEAGYTYFVTGKREGTVTITATARGDNSITTSRELSVTNKLDTSLLEKALQDTEGLYETLYTPETYTAVIEARTEALLVMENPLSSAQIDEATIKLNIALSKLKLKGSNIDQPESTNLIDSNTLSVVSFTSQADTDYALNTIDGDEETIWHTSYQSSASLPVEIVYDLHATYAVEQLNFLPNTRNRNGDVVRYRIEVSMDGETFTPVVEDTLAYDNSGLVNRSSYKVSKFDKVNARYVKFIALESLGSSSTIAQMNRYASIAEVKLFGVLQEDVTPIESITFAEEAITLYIGDENHPVYEVTPLGANEKLVWSTDDASIAQVVDGKVTAVAAGSTTIHVKAKGSDVSASLNVTVKAIDIDGLRSLSVQVTSTLNNDAFMETVHAVLKDALVASNDVAVALLARFDETPELVTSEEIVAAFTALQSANANLEYRLVINELVELVNLDLGNYDQGTIADYQVLQTQGQTLLDDLANNLENVAEMVTQLKEAKDTLVDLDKQPLRALVATVKAMDLDIYTEATRNEAVIALTAAETVLDSATTNQELVDALDQLQTKVSALVRRMSATQLETIEAYKAMIDGVDLSKYQSATADSIVAMAQRVTSFLDGTERTEAEATAFIVEIQDFKSVIDNPDLEVDVVDRTALEQKVAEVKALDGTKYTEVSWNALQEALQTAQRVLLNADATQADINAQVTSLERAIQALVIKTDESGVVEGFKGLPGEIRVGDKFTLYPEKDDHQGRNGWTFDETFFAATFNSPATFVALKEGTTEIKYTSQDGSVQRVVVNIQKALPKDTNGGTLVQTGVANNVMPIVIALSAITGGIYLVIASKRKKRYN
ncbi:DUF5110 domain-containing protein [Erysipelothrix sp. HDW6C]|uniref:discoidin domain-containing protein n=1 Tax=Erysipelothrix sp. HDW6C TaxID=2714930 RepID=UPI00140996B4|nr:discoidin domain-containing protein [Erysipelothrix sp. HDW6C]QIK69254.1 DUF5110 domain-containing protein [Erysipelothrix sp. HDW6C]